MAKYKFDGKYLKMGSKVIANVQGDNIREGRGSNVIANIKGSKVREKRGSNTLFNLQGDKIRLGNGSSKIATMDEIRKEIDGPGGITLAALWFNYIR